MFEGRRQRRVQVIDSHTAGEPTRVVIAGGPALHSSTSGLAPIRAQLQAEHDAFRTGVLSEPRGSDVLVGALLCEPHDASAAAGVVFFNDVGYLGMCGHGTIGLVVTLAHLDRLSPGTHRIETPVGTVCATLHTDSAVSVQNVASYRWRRGVAVHTSSYGDLTGDIAWGGNWFFLCDDHGLSLESANHEQLTHAAREIREALLHSGVRGEHDAVIDHIELFGPAYLSGNAARNFVLCPGTAFDRSPCGTGTSAKLACLYADGKIAPGQIWRQEGILGTVFEGSVQVQGEAIIPTITGRAYVTAESTLLFEDNDPFREGIRL